MFETIFLNADQTLRISFAYSLEAVEKIKQIDGATWDKASKTWRAPLGQLDKVLRVFPDAAMAPEVAMAGPAKLPIEHFAETCVTAGVTLTVSGSQVRGSGGAWTQILQAEIDKRAAQLMCLIASGWQPPVPMEVRPAPVPESFDHITDFDRGAAKWEKNWQAKQDKVEGYKAAAQRRRWHGDKAEQMGMFEQEGL